jgi:hypothetical protein
VFVHDCALAGGSIGDASCVLQRMEVEGMALEQAIVIAGGPYPPPELV